MTPIRRILSIILLIRICLISGFSLGKVLAFSPRFTRARRLVNPPISTVKVSAAPLHVHSTPTAGLTSNTTIDRIYVEAEAEHLKQSIVRWLDAEYTPHPLNHLFGKKVATIYTRQLLNGGVDLTLIHQQLQDTLGKIELKDIVIDAEDVADKVCEIIIARFDQRENVKEDIDIVADMDDCEEHLRSDFNRYQFLCHCLEGLAPPEQRSLAVAVQLGFRLQLGPHGPHLVQDQHLAPLYWENLSEVPDFADVEDLDIQRRLEADMPDEIESVDVVMETLAGQLAFAEMKANTDPHIQRRILIARWMYVHGFFNDRFPPVKRYVPSHLQEKLDKREA